MVVFTCGHCGESVTKPKVEKHYQTKCRNRDPNLSCMDCFKDFYGDAYQEHIKCITEEQRYSAKGFVAKEKKGEQKQNAWVELVQSVLDEEKNAAANVLRILNTVSKHNNTPRKKPKFINFVKNVCGHKTHPRDIDAAWDLISVKLTALSKKNQNQNGDTSETKNPVKAEEVTEDTNDSEELANGATENGDVDEDKKSKKQRKEEKKRQKYEAALESAAHGPTEEEEETEHKTKKEKKKNKESNEAEDGESKKNKKRKRLDTTNSVVSTNESDMPEAKPQANSEKTEKTKKKKPKVDGEEDDDNANLHDQNVAGVEQLAIQPENFNWHAVIISVLEKKGNELPFKRLQKKVLSEYSEVTGYEIDDRIADKFIKKLKSAPNVRVDKNRVTLND